MNRIERQLVSELQQLLRLTATEAAVARLRTTQAATEAFRREITENAEGADAQVTELREVIAGFGTAPDLVGAALGRASAFAQTVSAQGLPLTEAMLADLGLEHALVERARFVAAIADTAKRTDLVELARRHAADHQRTVEWIRVRLAEVAIGGPAALKATPSQAVAGAAQRLSTLPLRLAFRQYNRTQSSVQRVADRATDSVSSAVERAQDLIDAIEEIFTASRAAGLERAEDVALVEGRVDAARSIHAQRREMGALETEELPIPDYGTLSVDAAESRVRELDRAEDVRAVLSYEESHRNRKGVAVAAQRRISELAEELAVIED